VFGLIVLLGVCVHLARTELAPWDRGPALGLLAVFAFGGLMAGGIGRLSFGGSLPGSEPLPREITSEAVRDAFHDMSILASADPSRVLIVNARTPAVIRWYGRDIRTEPAFRGLTARPFSTREAQPDASSLAGFPLRTPLKTTSFVNRADLNPLGVARWMVGRGGLIQGRTSDIIISR
jgi:hypothetical protein